jgi:hypothetical protein
LKKIIFFTSNEWAFGSIHNALSKMLYTFGILSEVLDWTKGYWFEEMQSIINGCDYFITHPCAFKIITEEYKIPNEKIILVAHGQSEILLSLQKNDKSIFNNVHKYAVVSNILKEKSIEFGITRIPEVLRVGVHFDRYYRKVPTTLNSVGYASEYEVKNYFGVEIKRGRLVKEASEISNIRFVDNKKYHYLSTPDFYHKVDCVAMASIEDSIGLPMLEASCAGRLPIGTPVGYHAEFKNGIVTPLEEHQYVKFVSETINYYRDNPISFTQKCKEVQEFAKENFDWSHNIYTWVNLIYGKK